LTEADWHVDASVGGSGNGQTWGTALKTIREEIDTATDGDTVIVAEETYEKNIEFKGKNIILRGTGLMSCTAISRQHWGECSLTNATTEEAWE
jgi:fructose-specific component phosphotransferase system IIB-like protein